MRILNNGHPYLPQIDAIAANARSMEINRENDPETGHLAYRPYITPDTRISDDVIHLFKHTGTSRFHLGHRVHRRNGGGGCGVKAWELPTQQEAGWSEGLKDLPSELTHESYQKDTSYAHGPLPTPQETLLFQWKNAKQCRKWESKQLTWAQLLRAMNAHQKTGDAAMIRWEELDGHDLEPRSGDPLHMLLDSWENETLEQARLQRLEWLLHIMSAKEKEAITLTSQGMKRKQIAVTMGISDESAKTLIKRARKKAASLSPKTA